jgi:hypothetical protein
MVQNFPISSGTKRAKKEWKQTQACLLFNGKQKNNIQFSLTARHAE